MGQTPLQRLRSIHGRALALGVATLALGAAAALAAPGDLDSSFDDDGRRTFDFGGTDVVRDVLVQRDGKVLLAGDGRATGDVLVTRLNPDGSPDTSFDGDGTREYLIGGTDTGNAVAVQRDGRILVAARTVTNDQSIPTLIGLNPDGSTDTGFADEGELFLEEVGFQYAGDVLVQPDGKIVVAGAVTGNNFGVGRFNPDGSPDANFAGDGVAEVEFNVDAISIGQAIALQSNGKLVVAGTGGSGGDTGVARLNADGSPDTGFNGNGRREIDTAPTGAAEDVVVQPDGKIVLALAKPEISAIRLNPDGSFDTGFDGDGRADSPLQTFSAALQANGKIVLAGKLQDDEVAAVVRLQPGGSIDTTFSFDGMQQVGPGFERALGVALQPNGRILAGGLAAGDAFAARLEGDPADAGGGPPGGGPGGGPGPGGGGTSVPRCAGKRATIVGTSRKNRLRGTRRSDVIVALGGNDSITAGRGNDRICAGSGNDSINGESGNDRIYGQDGKDKLKGGSGNDLLDGGKSADLLNGQSGKDRLSGGSSRDRCIGGPGRDRAKCEQRRGI
jgi:uncharacterized delta-60 repeat protein